MIPRELLCTCRKRLDAQVGTMDTNVAIFVLLARFEDRMQHHLDDTTSFDSALLRKCGYCSMRIVLEERTLAVISSPRLATFSCASVAYQLMAVISRIQSPAKSRSAEQWSPVNLVVACGAKLKSEARSVSTVEGQLVLPVGEARLTVRAKARERNVLEQAAFAWHWRPCDRPSSSAQRLRPPARPTSQKIAAKQMACKTKAFSAENILFCGRNCREESRPKRSLPQVIVMVMCLQKLQWPPSASTPHIGQAGRNASFT